MLREISQRIDVNSSLDVIRHKTVRVFRKIPTNRIARLAAGSANGAARSVSYRSSNR